MDLRRHEELCKEIHQICVSKNLRYGDSFSNTVRRYGNIAALTRMSDKWQRIEQLILHPGLDRGTDESLTDSLKDMANYCLMTACELECANAKLNVVPKTATSDINTTHTAGVFNDVYREMTTSTACEAEIPEARA